MASYTSLASGPITLERWTDFKRLVLQLGTCAKTSRHLARSANWKAALHGDLIEPDDLQEALRQAIYPPSSAVPLRPRGCRWRCAIPDSDLPAPLCRFHAPPKIVRWQCATDPGPPASWSPPLDVNIFDTPGVPSDPLGPWFPAFVPAPQAELATLLDSRIKSKRAYTTRKYCEMAEKRSAAWFQLSSNMEADERGSRASISVEGLRRPSDPLASTSLSDMLPIAHEFFVDLHTPVPPTADRARLQASLLDEVSESYSHIPGPPPVVGPFSLAEVSSLTPKMHNTSPGPDGIPNQFWKALASRVASSRPPRVKGQPRSEGPSLPSFWKVLQSLTDDLRANGTDRLHFKDANLSLFYKKGDPTLVANYRPISSMNCDCKMYTNLINNRLSPWASSKLHPDQKGFVKGRWITEHTRLASEVAHLSNVTGSDGYIVSLDQAKAYDRTDLIWLAQVLLRMGLPPDLVSLIRDVVHGCRMRVRINSAYSRPYTLRRGVRQGDPLSCLLYAFSIEPMGMRLRRAIKGISVLSLPPSKLIMYADDTNLFLSKDDDLALIKSELSATSLAIGSKFNFEKTDILLVGSATHRAKTSDCPDFASLLDCFRGAYIIPDGSLLRILGVWVSSPDHALPRWKQIADHISKIIRQWKAIGASMRNRVVLAKALMMSRCYYLHDSNGAPLSILKRISQSILGFVRGRFSCAPYSILSAPLREGGLDCPSLVHRCQAYDAKFIGDLISAPLDVPWKVWTMADLRQASLSSAAPNPSSWHPNPLTQHAFLALKKLDPRVRQSIVSLRSLGYNIQCAFPSSEACADMPSLLHPMLPASLSTGSGVPLLRSIGASSVSSLHPRRWPRLLRAYESRLSPSPVPSPSSDFMDLDPPCLPAPPRHVAYVLAPPQRSLVPPDPPHIMPAQSGLFLGVDVPPHPSGWRLDPRHLPGHIPARVPRAPAVPSVPTASQKLSLRRRAASILTALKNRDWSPDSHYPSFQSLNGDIRIWPKMSNAYGCARILTQSPSILNSRSGIDRVRHNPREMPPTFAPLLHPPPVPVQAAPAHYLSPVVTVWTDGSAVDNGLETCVAGAGWFSDSGVFAYARVVGPMVSNNVAEVSAVIMALQAWQSSHLHIYTDSTFVLGLVRGGLLTMERDGWPDLPLFKFATPGSLRTMFQNLLGLLRRHNSLLKFSWVKGHSGVYGNECADKAAALGVTHSHFIFSTTQPLLEPGWVDSAPVLNHQPLSHLTYLIVRDSVPPPFWGPSSPLSVLSGSCISMTCSMFMWI